MYLSPNGGAEKGFIFFSLRQFIHFIAMVTLTRGTWCEKGNKWLKVCFIKAHLSQECKIRVACLWQNFFQSHFGHKKSFEIHIRAGDANG